MSLWKPEDAKPGEWITYEYDCDECLILQHEKEELQDLVTQYLARIRHLEQEFNVVGPPLNQLTQGQIDLANSQLEMQRNAQQQAQQAQQAQRYVFSDPYQQSNPFLTTFSSGGVVSTVQKPSETQQEDKPALSRFQTLATTIRKPLSWLTSKRKADPPV